MNMLIKIWVFILGMGLGGSLFASATPNNDSKVSQELALSRLENESEQVLIKLAQSLGHSFTKAVSINDKSSMVNMELKNGQSKLQAYIQGTLNSLVVGMAYIDSLEVVNVDLRGKGIAQLLCKSFYDICREKGCKKIAWHASSFGDNPIPDDKLIAFYKKIGGEVEEEQMYSTYMTIDISGKMSAHK